MSTAAAPIPEGISTCGSCLYFSTQFEGRAKVCRNGPPVFHAESLKTFWPRVNPETDWCGDHVSLDEWEAQL